MGILEVWSIVRLIFKMHGTIDYTYWQVFKPMWLGYSIIFGLYIGFNIFYGLYLKNKGV